MLWLTPGMKGTRTDVRLSARITKGCIMKIEEAARRVIGLAEAIRSYWETELPRRHPNYPLVDPEADSGPPPVEEKQLRQFLGRLSEDTVYKLALIMYLGRGDFDTSDLPGQYRALREDFDRPSAVIAQMMDKAPLAEYLQEGMKILTSQQINLDKMDFTAESARK